MIRQDYLLRLIEQATQMLAKLLGLQARGNNEEAAQISREAAGKWLQLDPDSLRSMDDGDLIDHLQRHGPVAEFQLRLGLAIGILRADGDRHEASGDPAARLAAKANALNLLLRAHIMGVAPDLPGFTPRLADLLGEVPFDELPPRTLVLQVCHHEHLGQFAMAEDVLFAWRHRDGPDDMLLELGRQFYQRLKRRTDDELVEGNLPRAEVEQGEAEWNQTGS